MIAFGKFKSNDRLRLVVIAFGKLKRDKDKTNKTSYLTNIVCNSLSK
jgi:hypothetical protein